MAAASNLFEPLAARQLIAAGLTPVITDVRKPLAHALVEKSVGGLEIVTISNGVEAVIVLEPFKKLVTLRNMMGDTIFIQKVLSDTATDSHLGQAVCRVKVTPAAPRRQGKIEVNSWNASGRSVAILRKLRGVFIPPELSITYDKSILEAA